MLRIFAPTRIALATLLLLCPLSSWAEVANITVVDGQLHTSSGAVPAACLMQLRSHTDSEKPVVVEVNGAVECKNPAPQHSAPQQGAKSGSPRYSILATLPEQVYQIQLCEDSQEQSCSEMHIQFSQTTIEEKSALVVNRREGASGAKARESEIDELYQAVANNTTLSTKIIESDCTNPGLTGEEPFGGRQTLYRFVDGKVAEINDELTTLYGTQSVQFLLKDGEFWFALLEIRAESIPAMGIESGYETDTRLYFDKEKLFLCKLTYPNDGPAGSIPGQITELPCSELHHIVRSDSLNESQRAAEAFTIAESIDGLLAHGRKLLSTANASTKKGHDDWCKEGGGF